VIFSEGSSNKSCSRLTDYEPHFLEFAKERIRLCFMTIGALENMLIETLTVFVFADGYSNITIIPPHWSANKLKKEITAVAL